MKAQTIRHGQYDLTCSAQPCDNGTFQPALVLSRTAWPSRPRTIAMRRDRCPSPDVAIESACAQGLDWIKHYG